MVKIKEMTKEEKNKYFREKVKEWRLKNPIKNKKLRKKYKNSKKGIEANKRYNRKYFSSPEFRKIQRAMYRKNPITYKQKKGYIRNYMKEYLKNQENHRKYLIRQRDRAYFISLKQKCYCQICGSRENLEIHHKKYDESKDIMLLCRICHRKLHRKY